MNSLLCSCTSLVTNWAESGPKSPLNGYWGLSLCLSLPSPQGSYPGSGLGPLTSAKGWQTFPSTREHKEGGWHSLTSSAMDRTETATTWRDFNFSTAEQLPAKLPTALHKVRKSQHWAQTEKNKHPIAHTLTFPCASKPLWENCSLLQIHHHYLLQTRFFFSTKPSLVSV